MKNNQHPKVSIIIVTYNAARFLPTTLNSVKMQQGVTTETIVIDNASSDDTLSILGEKFPWVQVVALTKNLGFSAANNVGLQHAKGDYLLFFNPDISFLKPDDLARCLVKYKESENLGFLTARVNLVATGKLDETSHRGFPTPWASFTHFSGLEKLFPHSPLFARYTMGYLDQTTEHQVDAVGGMFMLTSRAVMDQIGNWDEAFPLYGEDLDLCYRAKEKGYNNLYWPGVTVLHYKGATTGMNKLSRHVSSATRATTRQVKSWSVDAMELFYRKHYEKKYPRLLTWIVRLGTKLLRLWRTKRWV